MSKKIDPFDMTPSVLSDDPGPYAFVFGGRASKVDPLDMTPSKPVLKVTTAKQQKTTLLEDKNRPGYVTNGDSVGLAKAMGHPVASIADQESAARNRSHVEAVTAAFAQKEQERRSYEAAIMALPEADKRPLLAIKIASAHNAKSMPVERAAMFLRGLPEENAPEHSESTKQTEPNMSTSTLKRRLEVNLAGLSTRAERGDLAARSTANKITYALRVHAEGLPLEQACDIAGVDLKSLR